MVTILLATYNGEKYIRKMVDSILAQTFTQWKLILSDDGSSDHTTDILQEYAKKHPQKITWYQSGQRFGSAQTHFMHLLEKIQDTPYIMFCDQDDVWHPDKIEKTLSLMKQTEKDPKEPVMVHTDLRVVDQNLQEINPSFTKMMNISGNRLAFNQLLVQNVVTGCTMMINQSLAELSVTHLPEEKVLMHDWWLALIAAAFGTTAFLPEATIDYRQHGNNTVGAKDVRSFSYIAGRLRGDSVRKTIFDTFAQAAIFAEAFDKELTGETRKTVYSYARLGNANKLQRIMLYCWGNYWKYGLSRIIGQIIFG